MMTRFFPAFSLALFFLGGLAQAQLTIRVEPVKSTLVAHESMKLVVQIRNFSGQDLTLDAPGQREWLTFSVRTSARPLVTSTYSGEVFRPQVLGAGRTIQKTVDLKALYDVGDFGSYWVTAHVWYPPTREYLNSNQVMMNVVNAQVYAERTVGVPPGRPGAGEPRAYQVMLFKHLDETEIYVRVKAARTQRVYATYSLGPVVMIKPPQVAIDRDSKLHLLYMGGPGLWLYSKVDVDGRFLGREFYKDQGVPLPKLATDSAGFVRVDGGRLYDPANPEGSEQAELAEVNPGYRRLSDRPGFLNQSNGNPTPPAGRGNMQDLFEEYRDSDSLFNE
ncbi:MAG: hypothetical protein AAF555_06620 [Verrucomicrobiota bacterium]